MGSSRGLTRGGVGEEGRAEGGRHRGRGCSHGAAGQSVAAGRLGRGQRWGGRVAMWGSLAVAGRANVGAATYDDGGDGRWQKNKRGRAWTAGVV